MKILCKLFGHKYRLHKVITNTTREVKCKRCKMIFAMNDVVRAVLPMDKDFETAHEVLLCQSPTNHEKPI